MYSLSEVAREYATLVDADVDHLQRLVANWGLLADLSFTDLVLFAGTSAPASRASARSHDHANRRNYVVLAQVRPTTSQTLYQRDLVGVVMTGSERPFVERCLRSGEMVGPDELEIGADVRASILAVPVRREGQVIAVLTSEGLPSGGRRHGELENAYLTAFSRLARMVSLGEFPFPADRRSAEGAAARR